MTSASAPAWCRVDSVDLRASARDSSASLTFDARNSDALGTFQGRPRVAARLQPAHLDVERFAPSIQRDDAFDLGDSFEAMAAAIWDERPTLFWGETVVRSLRRSVS